MEQGTMLVWRQDQKAVRALGGRSALRFYKVGRWEVRKSNGPSLQKALAWEVPCVRLAAVGVTPLTEPEAMALWREHSDAIRARSEAGVDTKIHRPCTKGKASG